MQNPYLAVIGISYIAIICMLSALLLGIPLFANDEPCSDHPVPCAQTAISDPLHTTARSL